MKVMSSRLLTDTFMASLADSAADLPEAKTLPAACYTSAEFYDFEKEALYLHEWLCAGRESWAAKPGDYFTTRIIGEPVIVSRTLSGELKAMSAVCQHRAMLVAEGSGNT